ncbi:phage tail tape measure protein [Enterobacter asburiae]|uniref:Phage tail tape measure protein domain-containing protein n=3 Tax=Gammaproteobacteria TaxID=1236 RepID=A0ABC9U7I4_ENTAS|nr:phage tail tape measure protein [Enterobacter asburiae]ESM30702.1 hypothetical protein L402_03795 [Enterobacter asburiae]
MARNLQLALQLLARDTGSKVLKQALQGISRDTKAAQKTDDELAKSRQQNSTTAIRASRSLQDEYRRASSARSTLGIRSERDIQREIQQTMAAYNRLTRTGMLSANEQTRAFSAMKDKVRNLRSELNGVGEGMSQMQKLGAAGSTISAVAGGVMAAGATLIRPVSNQMSYQQRLAMMANTAYADQGLEGRRTGMKEMDSLIRHSVKTGGGTKESAAETLDAMLASGSVSMESAKSMLPMIQKYSTATGADPADLANIAIKLKQSFGIQDSDLDKALNMSISAGQSGSFELKDMAKWLPSQLASAGNAGMKGLDDFAVLLGWNQASAITAGSSDQAGNNLNNLLLKLNSQDAANAAARIKLPSGRGVDLSGSLAKGVGKGVNPLETFNQIVDKVVASNPAYKKLEEKLKTAPENERKDIINSQAKILEGSGIGKIIADQQALLALLGYRGNKTYTQDVISEANSQRNLSTGKTAGDLNFSLMSEQPGFKLGQLDNERDFQEMDSVKPLSDSLGYLSDKLLKYAEEYPGLTRAVSDAAIGIKAMASAAAVFGAIKWMSGRGIRGGKPAGSNPLEILAEGASGSNAVPVYVTNAQEIGGDKEGFLDKFLGGSSDLPGQLGKWASYANVANILYESAKDKFDSADEEAKSRGITTGELFAQKLQEKENNKKPLFDVDLFSMVKSWWSSPATIGQNSPATTGVPSYLLPQQQQKPQPVNITTKVMLDNRQIAEAVNEYNGDQSVRGSTGGPQ